MFGACGGDESIASEVRSVVFADEEVGEAAISVAAQISTNAASHRNILLFIVAPPDS